MYNQHIVIHDHNDFYMIIYNCI